MDKSSDGAVQIQVWDLFVRFFHWSVVLGFVVAYFSAEELEEVHEWSGYAVFGLVMMRLVWGVVGSRYARFSDFVYTPRQLAAYLSDSLHGVHLRFLGHNPLGGVMVTLLLGMLLLVTLSGMALYGIAEGGGPLAGLVAGWGAQERLVKDVHEISTNVMMVMIGLHVAGNALHYYLHRENLVKSMWIGRKAAVTADASEKDRVGH